MTDRRCGNCAYFDWVCVEPAEDDWVSKCMHPERSEPEGYLPWQDASDSCELFDESASVKRSAWLAAYPPKVVP